MFSFTTHENKCLITRRGPSISNSQALENIVSYLYQANIILKGILNFLQSSCVFLILPFQMKFQTKPTENLPCLTRQDAGYPGLFRDWRKRIWRMESDKQNKIRLSCHQYIKEKLRGKKIMC